MNEDKLRQALKESLTDFPAARQQAVIRQIRGEDRMKRKISAALAFTMVLTLLMAGAALAAALGVFGQLAGDSAELQRLEEHAVDVNAETAFKPVFSPPEASETDYDRLLATQYDRRFTLSIQQAYCDGNRLYYSYTLQTDPVRTFEGEGMPTGVKNWYMEEIGKRYEDIWSNADEARDAAIRQKLSEGKWYAYETWGLGDGAQLADGTNLNILDSSERMEDGVLLGYQEVALPSGFAPGDTLTFEVSVLYGMHLVHQDETGVRAEHIVPPENRGILRFPVTIDLNGTSRCLTGAAAFPRYTAEASLLMSDVSITGTVRLRCPSEWTLAWDDPARKALDDCILGYVLSADGQLLPNQDGGLRIAEDGLLEIGLHFDLPAQSSPLALCPEYAAADVVLEEGIVLNQK